MILDDNNMDDLKFRFLNFRYSWKRPVLAPHEKYILVLLRSGYSSTPFRAAIAKYSRDRQAWVDHSFDRLSDSGDDTILAWMEIPIYRIKDKDKNSE